MSKKVAIIISPNYKDYAEKYLAECIDSIRRQDYAGEMKIFISDNESTEESYRYVESILREDKIPPTLLRQASGHAFNKEGEYEIIRNKNNDGFAKGNNDAIKKALEQGFEYVILFNIDTVLQNDCVGQMIRAMEDEKFFLDSLPVRQAGRLRGNDKREIGAVQARLMLYKDNLTPARHRSGGSPYKRERTINSLGNVTHFLGFGYSQGYGAEYGKPHPNPLPVRQAGPLVKEREICYPSGAAVLFKAEVLKKVGLFDEEFWLYNEDQDLGWRIWLSGFSCVLAPEAVIYHKYEFSRSLKKYYWLDRNRIIAMLKNYHWITLILIAPAFLTMEIGLIFFAFKGGWLKEKIKVYKYFLSLKNWRYIRQARRQTQKLRQVKDKDIIKLFSGRIWYQEIGDIRLRVANVIFGAYWRVVKVFIRW